MSASSILVGQRIRQERRRRGLSQKALVAVAPALGSRAHLSRLESGVAQINSLEMYELATALSVPMDAFFDEARGRLLASAHEPKSMQPMTDWALELLADIEFAEREVAAHGWDTKDVALSDVALARP